MENWKSFFTLVVGSGLLTLGCLGIIQAIILVEGWQMGLFIVKGILISAVGSYILWIEVQQQSDKNS
jgi:hypothetical protein